MQKIAKQLQIIEIKILKGNSHVIVLWHFPRMGHNIIIGGDMAFGTCIDPDKEGIKAPSSCSIAQLHSCARNCNTVKRTELCYSSLSSTWQGETV